MGFKKKQFIDFILENDIIGFFEEPKTLSSGRQSSWYVNWRIIADDVFLLDQLTDFVLDFAHDKGIEPDCFYGVPEGATKLGLFTQYKWATRSPSYGKHSHALPMGRGNPKQHGAKRDRYFIGEPRDSIALLEDVTTTGGSLIRTIDQLLEDDKSVPVAIAMTNRMELTPEGYSVEDAIQSRGVSYFALSNAFELLPPAYAKKRPGPEIGRSIEHEFQEYGIAPLRL
ncbi:MAG: hypothetical protein ACQESG_02570 [Nanobdellota archaeon]